MVFYCDKESNGIYTWISIQEEILKQGARNTYNKMPFLLSIMQIATAVPEILFPTKLETTF
jgi:hypothetical protein